MTGNSSLFTTFQSYPSTSTITLAEGSTSCVLGSEAIHSTPLITFNGDMSREWSVEPLEIPLGLMTRARAKRFKEALNVLIRDAQVEKAHVFNSKEETKMVHVIKVNPDLDQEPGRF